VLVAESEDNAERILWDLGLTIIDLRKRLKLPSLQEAVPSMFGVKRRDVIDFSRNLASLLEAGIPIMRALAIQARIGKRALRSVLHEVIADLEKGSSLSEACARHPLAFPSFYVYLLMTGERVGNLSQVLKDVAFYMERDDAIKSKIKRSLAYPSFVLLLAVGAVFIMITFVVPALTSLVRELGTELPLMTKILISVSDFFQANALYMIVGVVGIGVVSFLYTRTQGGKRRKDAWVMKIPMVGQAILKGGLARFCRNMSMLVGAGVTLLDALKLTSETTDNIVIAEAIAGARARMADGQLFSEAVIADPFYPVLMAEMIGIGEESGSLEEQLTKVSTYYEAEADRAIETVTGMLTPALTVGVGLLIGLIAVSIFGSIYQTIGSMPG
jgi:type IV pilus assembly protein PilC